MKRVSEMLFSRHLENVSASMRIRSSIESQCLPKPIVMFFVLVHDRAPYFVRGEQFEVACR